MMLFGRRWLAKAKAGGLLAFVDFVLTASSLGISAGIIFGIAGLTDLGILDAEMLTSLLSLVCPLVTMIQFVSPVPVVVDAVRKLDGQDLPIPVFQSQTLCNILGLSYSIQVRNTTILFTNLFGLACQIIFLACARLASSAKGGWLMYGVQLTVLLNVGLYICAAILPINILGHTITLFNIVLFAAPLAKLGSILRTRSATSLPTAMIVISAVNNALWTLYGILIQDMVVLLPSILGFLLSGFQVLVLLWCHHQLPFDLAFLLLPCRDRDNKVQPTEASKGAAPTKVGAVDHWAEPDWEKQDWEDRDLY